MIKPWPGIVDVEPMPTEETAGEGSASDEPEAARGESGADAEPAAEEADS
jgi:hypothetical protein